MEKNKEREKQQEQVLDQSQDHKKEAKIQAIQPEIPDEEKPFDFGGLPDKDLKKNLGCG